MDSSTTEAIDVPKFVAEQLSLGREYELRPIDSGNSADQVFVLEILGAVSINTKVNAPKSGRYIFKLSRQADGRKFDEEHSYAIARKLNKDADYCIVPEQVLHSDHEVRDEKYAATLSEIAGRSLAVISAPVGKLDERVLLVLPKLFTKMYEIWSAPDVEKNQRHPTFCVNGTGIEQIARSQAHYTVLQIKSFLTELSQDTSTMFY